MVILSLKGGKFHFVTPKEKLPHKHCSGGNFSCWQKKILFSYYYMYIVILLLTTTTLLNRMEATLFTAVAFVHSYVVFH